MSISLLVFISTILRSTELPLVCPDFDAIKPNLNKSDLRIVG